MSRLSMKLGWWSAMLTLILSIGYAIGVVLSLNFPLPAWTNAADFIKAAKPISLIFYTFVQIMAFFLAPVTLILFCSFHEYAPKDKKIVTRIGLCCIIAMMVLGSQMYFTHFNAMRWIISKGIVTGLEQFVEWNPHSFINASGSLGWTFFIGLAFLFVSPIFSGGKLERKLRYSSLILGICFLVGTIGVLFENLACLAVYFFGSTFAQITLSILAIILFQRLENGVVSKIS
jgi:hypothetical protein